MLGDMGGPDQPFEADAKRESGEGKNVFLSYSRANKERARLILKALEAEGISVWWDSMLEGGVRFHEVIEYNLENAEAIVVLWSETSVGSHWVHDEATRACERGVMVPVSIDGTFPPLGFRQFQWIDLAHWEGAQDDRALAKIIDAVRGKMDAPPSPPAKPAISTAKPTPKQFHLSRRAAIVGGGAALAGVAGVLAWQGGLIGGGGADALKRVAVMPFDLTGDPGDQGALLSSIADEVRGQLTRNPLLHVAAQTSSQALAGSGKTAKTICEELQVDYLLTGAVGLDGDMLDLNCELIEGQIDRTILPINEAVPVATVLALQSKIASQVISELTADEETGVNLKAGGTENVAAYNAYLEGREFYFSAIDEASDRAALAKFEEAVRIDPEYAAAHTMRSRALALIANLYGSAKQRDALYDESESAARRAIETAPDYPNAYTALGSVLRSGRLDVAAAREPYEKALELGSGDASILSSCADFMARDGHFDEARSAAATAITLDPLNDSRLRDAGVVEYDARAFAAAKDWFEKALAMRAGTYAHYLVGIAQLALGENAEARQSFEKETRPVWQKTGLAIADHRLGNRALAEQHFAELQEEQGDKSHYQYMQINAQWGDEEAAIEHLDAAWAQRDAGLYQMRNDPLLDPLRDHPRFAEIAAEIGFS